jgi:pimeloyl-ACP methyl ester carboxylesterase
MKALLILIGVLAALFGLVILAAYLLQDRMLFFPSSLSAQTRKRLKEFEVCFDHDGIDLCGWLYRNRRADGLPFLVYYGGNGEEVSWNFERFTKLPVSGFLLVNYRGYGDSAGEPSTEALKSDAVFIFDELVVREGLPSQKVVLMGRSLGTGIAVDLATKRSVAGLLLLTPFDRLSSIASHHYPFLPVRWLLRHDLDSITLAPEISVPSRVVLAENDRVVPPRYGRRLYEALAGPKELVTIPGADHNSLDGHEEYWRAVGGFLGAALRSE